MNKEGLGGWEVFKSFETWIERFDLSGYKELSTALDAG